MIKQFIGTVVFGLTLTLLATAALLRAGDGPPPDQVDVEFTVRGPDGRPVADKQIKLISGEPFSRDRAATIEVKADAHGLVRCTWPINSPQIFVIAPDVGYGATGIFPANAGQTSRPTLPRLAPVGTIEGTVPKELRKKDISVWLSGLDWIVTPTTVNEQGKFVLKHVPYGNFWAKAGPLVMEDNRRSAEASVYVRPGEHVRGLTLAMSAENPSPVEMPAAPAPEGSETKDNETIVWAEGTLRDEAGSPIEGAYVIARGYQLYGARMHNQFYATHSDARGHWRIEGAGNLNSFSGAVIAYKIGRPYVITAIDDPSSLDRRQQDGKPEKAAKHQTYDLVLPTEGCRLDVLLTQAGKPVADVTVELEESCVTQLFSGQFALSSSGDGSERFSRIVNPTAMTDETGTARFADLPPGAYTIVATDHGGEGTNTYRGIVVRLGKPRKFLASLGMPADVLRTELRGPDGKPAADIEADFSWNRIGESGGSSSTKFDRQGATTEPLGSPLSFIDPLGRSGLWQISYTYGAPRGRSAPWFHPFYKAEAFVAVSPLLQNSPPVVLIATRLENRLGSLVVELQDASGKPTRGYVYLGRRGLDPVCAATTDDRGEVRFDGVLNQSTDVEGYIPGLEPPQVGEGGDPLPADKEMIGKVALFTKPVEPALDAETRVVLRPKPIGYARGVVHPAKGTKFADYSLSVDDAGESTICDTRFDDKTGKFLIGPCSEGKAVITLSLRGPGDTRNSCLEQAVEIHADRIAEVRLDAPPRPEPVKPPLNAPQSIIAGMGEVTEQGQLSKQVHGIVLSPDGKSPVRGAQVALYIPGLVEAVARGTTNFEGKFSLLGSWYALNKPDSEPKTPAEPTVAAWLAGIHGAAIVPEKESDAKRGLVIVLPKSATLHGRVTVGGKPLTARYNQISVFAAHQGTGALHELLHVVCSADAVDDFELAGLTAGDYKIQAALDGIWLSRAVQVKVAPEGKTIAPITLDIGEPGSSGTVTIRDRQGNPLNGFEVRIIRPEGPLADRLWPKKFVSDAAGVVNVPPLEVGTHKIRIKGVQAAQSVSVTPLGDGKLIKLDVVVDP